MRRVGASSERATAPSAASHVKCGASERLVGPQRRQPETLLSAHLHSQQVSRKSEVPRSVS